MNKFNCRTRERWSPEKTEWCRGRMVNDKHLEQAVVVELKRPIELELSPIEYDLPIKITPIIKCDSASSICNGSGKCKRGCACPMCIPEPHIDPPLQCDAPSSICNGSGKCKSGCPCPECMPPPAEPVEPEPVEPEPIEPKPDDPEADDREPIKNSNASDESVYDIAGIEVTQTQAMVVVSGVAATVAFFLM
eukprot:7376325-Prymnesium_polylepis.1